MMEWAKSVILPLLVPLIVTFAPRLWPERNRRVQAAAEARVKRLEAVEKGLAVAAKLRADLGIEVSVCHLVGDLRRIMREFADPVTLSREALEDWARKPFLKRWWPWSDPPEFTVPSDRARYFRNCRYVGPLWLFVGYIWFVIHFLFTEFNFVSDTKIAGILRGQPWWIGWAGVAYCFMLSVLFRVFGYWHLAKALVAVRSLSEQGGASPATDIPTDPSET